MSTLTCQLRVFRWGQQIGWKHTERQFRWDTLLLCWIITLSLVKQEIAYPQFFFFVPFKKLLYDVRHTRPHTHYSEWKPHTHYSEWSLQWSFTTKADQTWVVGMWECRSCCDASLLAFAPWRWMSPCLRVCSPRIHTHEWRHECRKRRAASYQTASDLCRLESCLLGPSKRVHLQLSYLLEK